MIGRSNKIFIFFLLVVGCTPKPTDDCEECSIDVDSAITIENKLLDEKLMDEFVDQKMVPEALIYQKEQNQFTEVWMDTATYEILTYEGRLMSASVLSDEIVLFFEPFNRWDDALEMEVKSEYSFNLSLSISKDQNEHLKFIDYSKETNNIAWDYFENLFRVHYYLDEFQNNVPLKFINEGKTEWDG